MPPAFAVPSRPDRRALLLNALCLTCLPVGAAAQPTGPQTPWLDPAKASLDPQVRALLEQVAKGPSVDFMSLSPAARRKAQADFFMPLGLPPKDRVDVLRRTIDGPGGPLPIRIYTPRDKAQGPRPIMVYYHGGGMSVGSLEQYDPLTQRLSERSGAVIVSVDYRLTPENPFPAPMEDAYAGFLWTHANAAALGADPARLAVGGDSAGGNLAAVVAQKARDDDGPAIRFQLLIYPAVGYGGHSRSLSEFRKGYFFGADELQSAIDQYVTRPEQRRDPRALPILARRFDRLPPAFVLSAEYEVMRDDIEDYAGRMKAAGVPAELHRYRGMIHPFLSLAGVIDQGRVAIDACADKLRAGLASGAD